MSGLPYVFPRQLSSPQVNLLLFAIHELSDMERTAAARVSGKEAAGFTLHKPTVIEVIYGLYHP